MVRNGFTLIEVIFVILITSILAVVGLPKFVGVADSAEATKCKAFVGTLNRTVSHSLWSDAFFNDRDDIANSLTEEKLKSQIETPPSCGTAAQYAAAATTETSFIVQIAGVDYNVTGFAPTSTTPARWTWDRKQN